MTAWR